MAGPGTRATRYSCDAGGTRGAGVREKGLPFSGWSSSIQSVGKGERSFTLLTG